MDEKILIIDDDVAFLDIAESVLVQNGYDVFAVDCPAFAFPILAREKLSLVICDLHLPFITGEFKEEFITSFVVGIKMIKELHFALPEVPVIGLSAAAQCDLDRISGQALPSALISKPDAGYKLLELVKMFTEQGTGLGTCQLNVV